MTFHVYDNVNRYLFGNDKLTFKLMAGLRTATLDREFRTGG